MLETLLHNSPLFYFTQSIWRDEASSILVAEKPLSSILSKISFEPPVYYVLLHYWMKIFGNSEISARSLSLLGVALATIVMIFWGEKLFKRHWMSWFLPLLFITNPMIIYYAFEVRTYGWFIFFATCSLFFYHQQRWKWYSISSLLGFYTHTYFVFLLIGQAMHYLVTHWKKLFAHFSPYTVLKDPYIRSGMSIFIGASPWIIRLTHEMTKLKQSWFFPVDIQLIYSVLGNMFLGYEGTPGGYWNRTAYLSLMLLVLFIVGIRHKKTTKQDLVLAYTIVVPLSIVIGISFVKPFFVNRYLIPVTISEIVLLAISIASLSHQSMQKFFAIIILLGTTWFNYWYPTKHAKVPIRNTFEQVNSLITNDDIILAETPLVLFESIYYSSDRSKVFLYNPNNSPFPWYVGDAIYSPSLEINSLPLYPQRAFLIHEDGSYTVTYRAHTSYITRPNNTALGNQ